MGKYIKLFDTHAEYNAYINGSNKVLPNVSYCENENEVHYNPWTDPKLVCKYNITDTSSATTLRTEYEPNMFKSMEIDGVLLDSLVTSYQFTTTGEHIVKYELYDETKVGNQAPLFVNITTLTSISIPDSVTTIGTNAFGSCTGLTSVTIPNSVTSIGFGAFGGCSGLTSVTIGNSVTTIGERAFYNCNGLTSVTIPNSVTTINGYAFNGCSSLTSVTIGNSVTTIGGYVFNDCSSLTSVTIPNSVTTIGFSAFQGCSGLTSVTIGNSVTSIGERAFYNCNGLTSVTIPNSVTTIGGCLGNFTFENVIFESINPNATFVRDATNKVLTNITGDTLIWGFNNTVTIPNSVTTIYDYAFNGCRSLTSITIPNSVTTIGVGAFQGCSGLTSVTIGNSVTTIGFGAFTSCSGLTSVTIPNSVTTIGNGAFYNCSGLMNVTIQATTPPTLSNSSAFNDTNNCPIYVPSASVETYKSATNWSSISSRIQAIA